MAMPDRVSLLRVMQTRGVGGNAWRMSHNPVVAFSKQISIQICSVIR
jgi:hypothetical protein